MFTLIFNYYSITFVSINYKLTWKNILINI